MPRQTANGQSQNATFLAHTGIHQPIAQVGFTGGNGLFKLKGCTTGRRIALTPLWPGRVQVQDRQAWVAAFGLPRREKTAAVGKGEQIADLGTLPRSIGHTRRQHFVEQEAARRGEQTRTHVALLRQRPARGPLTGVHHVAAVVAKTLGAEIVGNAVLCNQLQPRVDGCGITGQLGQAQGETIG